MRFNKLFKGFQSMININGAVFSGRSISIVNGKIIVDGKDSTPEQKEINITVNGSIDSIDADVCSTIIVTGDCASVKTMSGDVEIRGNISGNVQTMSGDVSAQKIAGSCSSMSGDICKN